MNIVSIFLSIWVVMSMGQTDMLWVWTIGILMLVMLITVSMLGGVSD